MTVIKPCPQCPWRLSNQGKPHKFGFYTKANLRRLWNQVRRGGNQQSCHLTDPSHPDHVAVGAKPGAKPQECPGSVILVVREIRKLEVLGDGVIGAEDSIPRYLKENKKGLTKSGLLYWVAQRIQFAKVPMLNRDGPLPDVDEHDAEIGLPKEIV